jgi:hypothetical protein
MGVAMEVTASAVEEMEEMEATAAAESAVAKRRR